MTFSNPSPDGMEAPPVPGSAEAAPVVVQATPMGVRDALAEMRARFAPENHGPDMLGMAETVLAEVLNNVVEHAYGGGLTGPIELRMTRAGGRLMVDVRDFGMPMPDGTIPNGALPPDDEAGDGPPEGGFGWFLIRALARDIAYARFDGQNRLTFCVPLADT